MSNKSLHKSKEIKNNEFYTQMADIENELQHYKEHFKGKKVYCPCDGKESMFVKYFTDNYDELELDGLEFTSYDKETKEGSYNSEHSLKLLSECDIVVTNPPFTSFRKFAIMLLNSGKDFLVIGPITTLSYKDINRSFRSNEVRIGVNQVKKFIKPDGSIQTFGNIYWFTTLIPTAKRELLELNKAYNPSDYVTYENYDAINVSKIKDIPIGYKGEMGVPVTFLIKHNPDQFELVALGIVGSIDFTENKRMEIIKTGKHTRNAKGFLYIAAQGVKDPTFKDCITGELYDSVFTRIIIKAK